MKDFDVDKYLKWKCALGVYSHEQEQPEQDQLQQTVTRGGQGLHSQREQAKVKDELMQLRVQTY